MENFPTEIWQLIVSFLGPYNYPASMVPYLRNLIPLSSKEEFRRELYSTGNLKFISRFNIQPEKRDLVCAAMNERMEVLGWCLQKPLASLIMFDACCRSGKKNMIEWALSKSLGMTKTCLAHACASGDLDCVKFLLSLGVDYDVSASKKTVKNNHVHILEYFKEYLSYPECAFAVKYKRFDVLEFIYKERPDLSKDIIKQAAKYRNKEIILWCEDKHIPKIHQVCTYALQKGKEEEILEFLQWLKTKNYPWTIDVNNEAARLGYLEILKWCKNNGLRYSPHTFFGAIKGEYQEIINHLYNEKCPWDIHSVNCAARNRNVSLLLWLKDMGCPFHNPRILNVTVHWKSVVTAVILGRCPNKSMSIEEERQVIKILKTLAKHKIFGNEASCIAAARRQSLLVLKWLRKHNCPWSEKTLLKAIINKDVKMVSWLMEKSCPVGEEVLLKITELDAKSPLKRLFGV